MGSFSKITKHDLKAKRFFVSVTFIDDLDRVFECLNAADDTATLKDLLHTFEKKSSAESIRVFDSSNGFAWICTLSDMSWDDFANHLSKLLDDTNEELLISD